MKHRSHFLWIAAAALLLLALWRLFGGNSEPGAGGQVPPSPLHPKGPSGVPVLPGPSDPVPPTAVLPDPSRKGAPLVVLGKLAEPGDYVPTPAILLAVRITPLGTGLKAVPPDDDGGFSFHWPNPDLPVSFEVRISYHAVVGDRTLLEEVAVRRVDLPGNAGPRAEAGTILLPEAQKLASLAGTATSAAGRPVTLTEIDLVSDELPGGGRLRLAGRGLGLDHAPNAPTGYLAGERFAFRHVPAGRYEITLRAPGHLRFRKWIELAAGAAIGSEAVVLQPSVHALSGGVVDAVTGAPIPGSRILLQIEVPGGDPLPAGGASVDAGGRFHADLEEGVVGRELRLTVSAEGYTNATELIPDRLLAPGTALHRMIRLVPAEK